MKTTALDVQLATDAAAAFIEESIRVHQGQGSSHSYSFWVNPDMGWHLPYPETTGYLLTTLIQWSHTYENFNALGQSCAQWLITRQNEEGWFHAGLYPKLGPSVFNTAVIAQGLLHADQHWGGFKSEVEKAYSWLMSVRTHEGLYDRYGYKGSHFPTYYTMVAWSMIEGGLTLNQPELLAAGEQILEHLKTRFQENSIENAGFLIEKPADLHTVSYALRGWVESMKLLQRGEGVAKTVLDHLRDIWPEHRQWPGSLWPNDWSFVSPTGEAQMALCLMRSGRELPYLQDLIQRLMSYQKSSGEAAGGFPGSVPFWGPYMTLRFPNWAAKFFLDLIYEYRRLNDQ